MKGNTGQKEKVTQQDIIDLLNIALIDEFLAEFNYFAAYNLSKTEGKSDFDPEFQKHEQEQRAHRYDIVSRLRQLNSPVPTKLISEFMEMNSCGKDWIQQQSDKSQDIIRHRYEEQLCAIQFYDLILNCIQKMRQSGSYDSTTQQLIKKIKGDEQEHAKDLRDLMSEYGIKFDDKKNSLAAGYNPNANSKQQDQEQDQDSGRKYDQFDYSDSYDEKEEDGDEDQDLEKNRNTKKTPYEQSLDKHNRRR